MHRVGWRRRALHSSPKENVGQDTWAEQVSRSLESVNYAIELVRHSDAAECRPVHTVHIPLQQLDTRRSLARQLWETIILERCAAPGSIDHRLDGPEPT